MTALLKRRWNPVWNKPNPPPQAVNDYLSNYDKKIAQDIPDITVDHFHKVMQRPRDSSTGPDGIPFSVFRHLLEVAAPLLFEYYTYMSTSGHSNSTFNHSNLFFFPKDGSFTTAKTRPISVSNTDNRIMANVIRFVITPAIQMNTQNLISHPKSILAKLAHRRAYPVL